MITISAFKWVPDFARGQSPPKTPRGAWLFLSVAAVLPSGPIRGGQKRSMSNGPVPSGSGGRAVSVSSGSPAS
jgi:hypothetical protein